MMDHRVVFCKVPRAQHCMIDHISTVIYHAVNMIDVKHECGGKYIIDLIFQLFCVEKSVIATETILVGFFLGFYIEVERIQLGFSN